MALLVLRVINTVSSDGGGAGVSERARGDTLQCVISDTVIMANETEKLTFFGSINLASLG